MERHGNNRRLREIEATFEFLSAVFQQVSKKLERELPSILDLLRAQVAPSVQKVEDIGDAILASAKNLQTITENVQNITQTSRGTAVNLNEASDLLTHRIKQEIANHTLLQKFGNNTSTQIVKASHLLVGANYGFLTSHSVLRLARTARKLNLKDPVVILQFSAELAALISHTYSTATHVDGIFASTPSYSKPQLSWDFFTMIMEFILSGFCRMGARKLLTAGGVLAREAMLQQAVALGLPNNIRGAFTMPFSILKKCLGKFRLSKSLIVRGSLSSVPISKVSLVKEKTKIFFSQVKKMKVEKLAPILSKRLSKDFSVFMNKKSQYNQIAIFAVENYKQPLPLLKADFVHFMVNNYNSLGIDVPVARVAPAIKDVIVQKTSSYKLRLVSPVSKFKIFKTFLNPFKSF